MKLNRNEVRKWTKDQRFIIEGFKKQEVVNTVKKTKLVFKLEFIGIQNSIS